MVTSVRGHSRRSSVEESALTQKDELRSNWLLLVTALVGGALLPIPFYAVSLFMDPWQQEFGWLRPEIGLANSCFTVAMVVASPLAGRVIDGFGPRRPAMASLVLLAVGFALVPMIGPDIRTLYLTYALLALAGSGISAIAFTRSVCAFFHKARGLALGITVTGTALTSLLTPVIVGATLDDHGWRGTWLTFSLLAIAVLPLLVIGLRDPQDAPRTIATGPAEPPSGSSLKAAVRTQAFWRMGGAFFLTSTAILAAIGHMTPILRESGLELGTAILLQSMMGVGLIVGRLLCGYVVDRVFAPLVFRIICMTAAAGFLLMALGLGPVASAIGVILVGAAMGAEYDLVAYLVSRYFGLAEYGRIYGYQFAFTMLGGVAGPFIIGGLYASEGSYTAYLLTAACMLVMAALLLRGLGPYPSRFAPEEQ